MKSTVTQLLIGQFRTVLLYFLGNAMTRLVPKFLAELVLGTCIFAAQLNQQTSTGGQVHPINHG